jgi:basic membrane protein A and related proteins
MPVLEELSMLTGGDTVGLRVTRGRLVIPSRRRTSLLALGLVVAVAVAAMLGGCGGAGKSAGEKRKPLVIGFLYVGPRNDFGYNQAAYQGSLAVKRAFPKAKILEAENVPESAEAGRVMEKMIRDGASIIFPTSFGHLQPALQVAKRHPTVTFLHQGGLETAPNLGTYYGRIYETQYAAGQAAGLATKTHRLGYVVAFPLSDVLLDVNAFELGAKAVDPKARTRLVFTGNWCDSGKQAEAANALLDQHADVITQNQDCTKTIIQTAERRGAMSVGYHSDASSVAPQGWLTASVWNWGPLMVKMVKTVLAGRFRHSPYSGLYRGGVREGIVKLAPFGPAATPRIRRKVTATYEALKSGRLTPFSGPIRDQSGKIRIAAGVTPSPAQLERTDYLVDGVIGRIPGD